MTKKIKAAKQVEDTLTVSDDLPPKMVAIINLDNPAYPERVTVAELDLARWLAQGWQRED